MTETETHLQRHRELLTEAVRVLTTAARLTYSFEDGDDKREEQADFAEFVSLAVAGAAANIGSIEQLLSGRPGSWEADHVRNLLVSTVGEDENYLLEHRTEPITVVVNVDDVLNDLGMWELYEEAYQELNRREEAVAPGDVDALSDDQEAALDQLTKLQERLDAQRQREWSAYGDAFRASVHRAAAELLPNLTVPVNVVVDLDWQGGPGSGESLGPDWRLWDWARKETPLPAPPSRSRTMPSTSSRLTSERDTGRRPLDRAERVAEPASSSGEMPGACGNVDC